MKKENVLVRKNQIACFIQACRINNVEFHFDRNSLSGCLWYTVYFRDGDFLTAYQLGSDFQYNIDKRRRKKCYASY